jgi:hypothetical protein
MVHFRTILFYNYMKRTKNQRQKVLKTNLFLQRVLTNHQNKIEDLIEETIILNNKQLMEKYFSFKI